MCEICSQIAAHITNALLYNGCMQGRPTFLERFSLQSISLKRLFGFAFFQLWVTLMFNSIEPYLITDDVRGSLYLFQFISLATMAFSLLLISITVPKTIRIGSNRGVVGSMAALMCVGTFCAVFADINTVSGMMYLSIGAILTGVGSAGLLIAWLEKLFYDAGRLAFAELAIAFLFAFALGLAIIFLPGIVIVTIALCLPLGSLVMLLRSGAKSSFLDSAHPSVEQPNLKAELINGENERGAVVATNKQAANSSSTASARAGGSANMQIKDTAQGTDNPRFSKHSILLFSKALFGCFLFGVLEGFFDRLSGYRAYIVQDIYGFYLLLGSLVAIAIVCVIAIVFRRDNVFYAYRFAMVLLCVGCLLTPFLGDNNTYASGALIFAGYNSFLVLLGGICIDVAKGFRLNPVKVIGIGVVALFAGEVAGMALERLFDLDIIPLDLPSITLVAVSLLFIGFLFLFNETDLIRIGIGDMDDQPADMQHRVAAGGATSLRNARTGDGVGSVGSGGGNGGYDGTGAANGSDGSYAIDNINARLEVTSGIIAERFALSQRESDVLPLLLQGRTISRIQNTLFISAGTVSTHIRHIYQKTGANNRQELIDLLQEIIDSEKDIG